MQLLYHDKKRDLLIYPAASTRTDYVLKYIPEAKQVNGYVAVPRTLRNCQILRYYNYPVTSIIDEYDWPAKPGIKPYESQKQTANFLVMNRRAFVLSDMGVGKTMAALWAADWLMSLHSPGTFRALIVCPLSIMQRVWGDAIFNNFLSRRTFAILHGDAEKRSRELAQDVDFYICNFDGVGVGSNTRKGVQLDGFSQQLAQRQDIKLAIVDEASAYKDATTKRHHIARQVFGKKPYLWLMTGTPVPNAPTDAYGLAKMMNNAHGKSFRSFQLETMVKVSQYIWRPKSDGYNRARALLQPAIRVAIDEVWDAPEMTTQVREVPLTAEQKKLMAALKKDLVIAMKNGEVITAVHEAAARMKFQQISWGAIYDQGHKSHQVDAGPRVEELKAVIAEASSKIIVFVGLRNVLELLYKECKQNWSCAVVNGDVSQKERSAIFQAFQSGADPRVLIVDPGCVAHGLDLFAARTVVWYSPTDKTELYSQGNKRAHRPGQRFPVTVVQIVSNTLEREIFKRLENNETQQGLMLRAVKENWL